VSNSWVKPESKDALLVRFLAKQFGSLLSHSLSTLSLHSYVLLFFCRVSLVEYSRTQGFITPVADEAQELTYFGPFCVTVIEVDDEEE